MARLVLLDVCGIISAGVFIPSFAATCGAVASGLQESDQRWIVADLVSPQCLIASCTRCQWQLWYSAPELQRLWWCTLASSCCLDSPSCSAQGSYVIHCDSGPVQPPSSPYCDHEGLISSAALPSVVSLQLMRQWWSSSHQLLPRSQRMRHPWWSYRASSCRDRSASAVVEYIVPGSSGGVFLSVSCSDRNTRMLYLT